MSGIDLLFTALEEVNAPHEMRSKALAGLYSDPTKTTPFPIVELANDCQNAGLPDIAVRAVSGEFDITLEEWEEFLSRPSILPDEPAELPEN